MNTYYFPIHSTSLAHYFGCACIKAAKYFNNKPQDIQDKYNDFLLLTSKQGTTETDCCLELVLTDDEIKNLIDAKNGWYLFENKPLPITRIRKIYFSNPKQKDVTITNITMSAAYVPSNLVEICKFDTNSSDNIQIPKDCQGVDQTNKINQYDRFLGALALMRIVHEPYMNYSQNYIATLSFFNQKIGQQVKEQKTSYKYAFQGIFNNSNGFEKVLPYLKHNIDENTLNNIAQENNQVIRKNIARIIDVESITDTWTYTIAILNTYGVGDESRKMRIDGLIQSHFKSLKEDKQEGVALCYGYNRGYSAFTKNYGDVAFKYKLESQLDYYTIESVYQYVFNGIVSSDFPYLDWCPKQQPKQSKISTNYVILDEMIIGGKKPKVFSTEWWNGFSQRFNKTFDSSKPIIEIIKNLVDSEMYSDIRDEIQEDIENKQLNHPIDNSLQKELDMLKEELSQAKERNRELQELINQKGTRVQYPIGEETIQVVAEPVYNYGNATISAEEKLKEVVIKYKDSTLGDLKKNVKLKDTAKLSELLLSQSTDLFSK